ncbi:MAG: hypothetical protein ACKVTZ_18785 [Bacteroidia bacterium]
MSKCLYNFLSLRIVYPLSLFNYHLLMTFEEFLTAKRIDIEAYRAARPSEWTGFEALYAQIGAKSFDQQKKFLFNPLRLIFPSKLPLPTKTEATSNPKKIIAKPQVPVSAEKKVDAETPNIIESTPPPSPKKMPMKMKPAIPVEKKEEQTEISEVNENQVNTPPPSPKKMPMKMKPVIPTEKKEEQAEISEVDENQVSTPPPSPKKMPMKMKPVIPREKKEEG